MAVHTLMHAFILRYATPDPSTGQRFIDISLEVTPHQASAEIDLLLEIPGQGLWAIEIKRSLAGRPEKGFYIACQDLQPDRRFMVNAGSGHYPIDAEITAIGLHELAAMLAALAV